MSEYCFTENYGDGDNVLGEEELVTILYKLNASDYLPANKRFEIFFVPQRGAILKLNMRTPKVITQEKTGIRI